MKNKETLEEVSPMTDLLKDLIQTKLKVKESIDLITNEFLASQINKFVQHTLDVIIERIENELLEIESKYQQERSYSEEDMIDFGKYLLQLSNSAMSKKFNMKMLDSETGIKLTKDLFKQFKKK